MTALPKDVFLKQEIVLHESHFDCNGQIKFHCLMEFMQNLATEHAEIINLGWNAMDEQGIVWVLAKVKFVLHKPMDRSVGIFTLYTWPVQPNRFFAERRFVAVKDGQELMSASTIWMIIDKQQRKALPSNVLQQLFANNFDTAPISIDSTFARIRPDDTFVPVYQQQIKRSQLDRNGHVNNTNYVTYAVDVLDKNVQLRGAEIVYHKECLFGDDLQIVAKTEGDQTQVCGLLPSGECCFTALLLHN